MRVIGGDLKGKRIQHLKSSTTRPLRDFVKESIFNIIFHSKLINTKISHSNILDLYSGVGSFGIECISHQASKVTFIENDPTALKVLRENLKILKIEKKSFIFNRNINSFFSTKLKNKFDIFFLDPPFTSNDYLENLIKIKDLKLYNKNNLIILHREVKKEEDFKKIFNITIVKKYGRSKIIFRHFN